MHLLLFVASYPLGYLFAAWWLFAAAILVFSVVVIFPILLAIGGRRTFQKVASAIAHFYWTYMLKNLEIWGRWEVEISGDAIPMRESAFIIANHRWGLDWLMIFTVAARKGRLGVMKLFAKDSIKWIPGIGWGLWLLDFPFLSRNWTNDVRTIDRTFQSLKDRRLPFWLVSHLEGTRLTESKVKQSQDFAKKKDLPVFKNVLLPRTKGFIATVSSLRKADAVKVLYDITIMYEDGRKDPRIFNAAVRQGGRVSLHVKRYLISDLPTNEEELTQWLYDRWREKDQLIESFLKTGHFPKVRNEPFRIAPLNLE